MVNYIIRKFLAVIPMLFAITFLVYAGIELMPGDAIDYLLSAEALQEMTQAEIDAFRAAKGLDGPMIQRYFIWLNGVLHGNFGYSLMNNVPVADQMLPRLGATLELSLTALMLSSIIGIGFGMISALKKGKFADNLLSVAGMIGIAVPQFIFGIICILVFCINLEWFPVGQRGTAGLIDELYHLFLPAIMLSTILSASVMRYSRSCMLESMNSDYVKTARAKGLSEWRVNFRHGFRVSCIPIIVLIGLRLPTLIGGSLITESLFQWPGMGSWFTGAIKAQNTPVVMCVSFFMILIVLFTSLLIDILTAVLDPRVRLS